MKNKTFNEKLAYLLSFGVGLIVFIILLFFHKTMYEKHKQLNRIETTEKYIYFQKDIANIVYSNINLLDGYKAFLSTQKDLSKENTESYLNELLKDKTDYIKNLTVLEDTTIVMSYPSKGNEASIGVDLSKIDKQKENVLKVKASLKPIFQGPVKLVQGGTGFIIRIPIEREEKYWGQLSVVIDGDRFIKAIEKIEKNLNIQVAIVNISEGINTYIYGNEASINASSSKFDYDIDLLNWMIYINPKSPNSVKVPFIVFMILIPLLFSILAGVVSWVCQKKFAKIRYHASYDNLTELYNRNYSNRHVPAIFEEAKKRNYKLGIMVLDINKFKSINDNYGHNVGDKVLKDFSSKLKTMVRNGEKVFRIGGDEFLIIFNKFEDEEALKIIKERIKESLNYTLVINHVEVKISSSIGYAVFPDHGENADAVIDFADKNMYEDKLSDSYTKDSLN